MKSCMCILQQKQCRKCFQKGISTILQAKKRGQQVICCKGSANITSEHRRLPPLYRPGRPHCPHCPPIPPQEYEFCMSFV
jgi:hypothetical protein